MMKNRVAKGATRAALLALAALLAAMAVSGACAEAADFEAFRPEADRALHALQGMLAEQLEGLYVYREMGDTENHFTQKARIAGYDGALVMDMDEGWRENPHSGDSCIRCRQITKNGDWGGWLFMNGWLPEGESAPRLNEGKADGQGMDLRGARTLRFWARGENGGEKVEFFAFGFGYDAQWNLPTVRFPDSANKRTTGCVALTDEWQPYEIDLRGADLSSIACGFGYVLSGEKSGQGEQTFFLDDIRYEGDFSARQDMYHMLRSYDTDNIYIKNAAFSYDNALAAMALLSSGDREGAARLLDAFIYAVEHDRYRPGRVRNAYAAGDITAFPGWNGAARLPGWYDAEKGEWYEDRYQTGSNVGNTAYMALALLQFDAAYGDERCLKTARTLMDWVIDSCGDGGPGFTAGYDGWPEGGEATTYPFSYKSIEHNIDAYAAFSRLYARTGERRYADAARSALAFVESMYDGQSGLFCTGTLDDGVTPSRGNVMLDAQVWACMALGDAFAPYEAALEAVSAMRTEEGGYPFCATNANGGWWAEGTAYTALMYRLRGHYAEAIAALSALRGIQLADGLFPAATVDNLSTGIELFDGSPWEYGSAPHLAPTAWFIMAVNGFNPYAFAD